MRAGTTAVVVTKARRPLNAMTTGESHAANGGGGLRDEISMLKVRRNKKNLTAA